jgi:hypothetical protein
VPTGKPSNDTSPGGPRGASDAFEDEPGILAALPEELAGGSPKRSGSARRETPVPARTILDNVRAPLFALSCRDRETWQALGCIGALFALRRPLKRLQIKGDWSKDSSIVC